MIYKIKRELNKIFLILCENNELEEDYRLSMLSENNIDGLIPVEVRSINGKHQLYYDITGKTNLIKSMASKRVVYDDLLQLFGDLEAITDELSKYLLDVNSLLFEPDLIMKNTDSNRYEVICIPCIDNNISLLELSEFLMENVDPEDEYAVKAAYQLYEMVNSGIDNLKALLDKIIEIGQGRPIDILDDNTVTDGEEIPAVYEDMEDWSDSTHPQRYRMSVKDCICAGFALMGLVGIGFWTYFSFFINNNLY